MKGLLTAAALAAGVAVALEAVLVLGLGWHPPSWALVVIPVVAAFAAFLGTGRLRAVRRQKRRRVRARRTYRRDVREPAVPEVGPSGPGELELVPVRTDNGGYQR
jgi:hypothetical protein